MNRKSPFERKNEIFRLLQSRGFLNVETAVRELGVSESTIRRDFNDLVKVGLASNEYGGIALERGRKEVLSVKMDEIPHLEIKRELCRAVNNEIQDGDTVFVDGGTTFFSLGRYIGDRRITIITNNALMLTAGKARWNIIFLGGQYNSKYYIATGEITNSMVRRFHFNTAFITCDAMDLNEGGTYAADIGIASIKQRAMQHADRKILVTDSSKFTKHGLYKFAEIGEFDCIITDQSNYVPQIPITVKTI